MITLVQISSDWKIKTSEINVRQTKHNIVRTEAYLFILYSFPYYQVDYNRMGE